MYTKIKINNYETDGDGGISTTPTVVSDLYDVAISRKMGELNDTFSFKLNNNRNVRDDEFQQQDNIQIHYLINEDVASSSNMIFNGLIKSVTANNSSKGKILDIGGVSYSEVATNGIVFLSRTNIDVLTFVQEALNSVKVRNPNFDITWDSNNPTTKSDGSSFPKILAGGTVREFNKSLNYILDKYLKDSYTGDGNYYWYVNNQKQLSIRKRTNSNRGILTEGVDFKSDKISVSDDIYNFIIIKCGFDPRGNPITTHYVDEISKAKYGYKPYVLTDQDIASQLIQEELRVNDAEFTTSTLFPSSYPYTISGWNDENGDPISVSTDAEWVAAIRAEAKVRGRNLGENFTSTHNQGFRNATIKLKPTLAYELADNISLTAPSYGLTQQIMRVTEILYDVSEVVLKVEEEVLA